MKVDNPLSREFIQRYPTEAAQVLEQVRPEHVAALFTEFDQQIGASVIVFMLPKPAAACLEFMTALAAAKLLIELPVTSAARILRCLTSAKQAEVGGLLPERIYSRIRRYQRYPAGSVGALLDPNIETLPQNITVADALRRIERLDHAVSCEIYIVDELYRLVGMIEIGRLLKSSHHAKLQNIISRKTQSLSVHANVETLLTHPGWGMRRKLPVVERDNTLVGLLEYSVLRNMSGIANPGDSRDPLENILSLASLYWISLAQLLDSVLSVAKPEQGEQK